MPRVTSLDGKIYEVDEETLARYRISAEDVQKLARVPPLPAAPAAQPPDSGAAQQESEPMRLV